MNRLGSPLCEPALDLHCVPLIGSPLCETAWIVPLCTALLNEHAHIIDILPVLPVISFRYACLPCLLRQKSKKNKNTQNVVRVVVNAAWICKKWLNSCEYSHCCTHVSVVFTYNSHSHEDSANMRYVFRIQHLSTLLSPCAAVISLAMALSQHGSLPDPTADTHTHFQALPRRPHALEEATYTGGLLVREVVEWAKGLDPSPTLIHINMREPERADALRKKR